MKHKTGKILAGIAVAAAAVAFALTAPAVTENTEWWDVPPTNTLAQVRTAAGFAKGSDLTTHTGNTTVHITATERTNWNSAYTKSQTDYVPSGGGFHDVGAGFTLVIPATNSVPGQSQSSHYYGGIRTKNGDDYTSYAHDGIAYHRNGVTYDFFWDLTDPYGIVRRTELSGYKPTQSAISSPSADGNTHQFIDTISQNANGIITATKRTVRPATTWQSGIVQLTDSYSSTSTSYAPTANALKNGVANAKSYTDTSTNDLYGVIVRLLAGKLGNSGLQTISFPSMDDEYEILFGAQPGGTYVEVYNGDEGSYVRYGYDGIDNCGEHLSLPNETGTLALQATTLSGYGITDALKADTATLTNNAAFVESVAAVSPPTDLTGYATETYVTDTVSTSYIRQKLGVYLYVGQDGGIYVHTPDEQ